MKGGKKRNTTNLDYAIPSEISLSDATTAVDSVSSGAEEGLRNSPENGKYGGAEEALEDEEGEDEDSEGDEDNDQLENPEIDAADGEKEKLADGYYEIEAVRRKRVRKGQVQYLIKWRGWSEAENTWEPLDNLLQVYDIIDAFEESMKAGKNRSTRKRKRKTSVTPIPTKKRQQRPHQQSPAATSYDVPPHVIRISEESISNTGQNGLVSTNKGMKAYVSNVNGINSDESLKEEKENGARKALMPSEEKMLQREMDLKLSELRGAMFVNHENTPKLSLSPQELIPTGRDTTMSNRVQKTDGGDSNQGGHCFGAKKRKCGTVKRFKRDPVSSSADDDAPNRIETCTSLIPVDFQHQEFMETSKNKHEDSRSLCTVTQIVKPISYKVSMTSDVQEVLVAFEAVRSDGSKVIVDNKFLKANNPLLLIEFYEKHLRYCPT